MNDKKEQKTKEKYYLVKVEGLIPAKLKFRVLATSPEHALEVYNKGSAQLTSAPEFQIKQIKKTLAIIYDWGTHMIRLTKRY